MKQKEVKAKDVFNLVKPIGWTIVSGSFQNSGQASVVAVDHTDGRRGVFRCVKVPNEKNHERFDRELKILKGLSHPNVVEILDHSEGETRWYISKRGSSFEEYWENQIAKFQDDKEALVQEALNILFKLLDALIILHAAEIVHRDIKAFNIIIDDNGEPQLIDFGITYVGGDERLTDPDEAPGNFYRPDIALDFMENVPAWIDVFLLSQLLIWMVGERKDKQVQRPMDWRWVKYSTSISEETVMRIKAITSSCSNPHTSPLDANELRNWIDRLFKSHLTEEVKVLGIEKLLEKIQKHQAGAMTKYESNREIFESSFSAFILLADELESLVTEKLLELQKHLPLEKVHENLRVWIERIRKTKENQEFENVIGHHQAIKITCMTNGKLRGFSVVLRYAFHTLDHVTHPILMGKFGIYVNIGFANFDSGIHYPMRVAVPDNKGNLTLYNMDKKTETPNYTVHDIKELIIGLVTDEKHWE